MIERSLQISDSWLTDGAFHKYLMPEQQPYVVPPESIEAYRVRVLFHCEELKHETNPTVRANIALYLAEAAADIQALLQQLEQSYPANSMTEKMTMATAVVEQIESNPSLKQKAVNALVAGGTKVLEAAIDHPVAAFIVGAIEEWQGS
ncbi:MAG: hypothetical protein F6K30_27745 [Cyanothece sp. SIO2G6]|nr:hypothetical protein [Cyanothece sp. SIO2G6]